MINNCFYSIFVYHKMNVTTNSYRSGPIHSVDSTQEKSSVSFWRVNCKPNHDPSFQWRKVMKKLHSAMQYLIGKPVHTKPFNLLVTSYSYNSCCKFSCIVKRYVFTRLTNKHRGFEQPVGCFDVIDTCSFQLIIRLTLDHN